MMEQENDKKEVYDLIRQGWLLKDIVKITGYSYSTVKRCKEELCESGSLVYEKERTIKQTYLSDLEVEWTAVVNVIRFYMGCRQPIQLPAGKKHPDPRWQKIAEENINRFYDRKKPLPLPEKR